MFLFDALIFIVWIMNDEVTYVSRETQPRSESEKMLAFFHLLTDGCRTLTKSKSQHGEVSVTSYNI